MSEETKSASFPDTVKRTQEYLVGVVFDVVLDPFTARLTTLADYHIRFQIAEGPLAHIETVKIAVKTIRGGIFAVSWQEASGATIVHVEDFGRGFVHSHATLPNGPFLRMEGRCTSSR